MLNRSGPSVTFEQQLNTYAALAIRVGVNLQPCQPLMITAPIDAVELVRALVKEAYRAGAGDITVFYQDETLTKLRLLHADERTLDLAPKWLYDGMGHALNKGCARLAVTGSDPLFLTDLLTDSQSAKRLSRMMNAQLFAYRPALESISQFAVNWSLIAAATAQWATTVFPGAQSSDDAVAKLWDEIFITSRANSAQPFDEWKDHQKRLKHWSTVLTEANFKAVHFTGPGTNLTVGLAEGHQWCGGEAIARNGVACQANLPTEEVFTAPHRLRVNGIASSTKPLIHQGTLIEGIRVEFKEGRIVDVHCDTHQHVFERLLEADEGARALGEVALVPHASCISQRGILYYNTLFDENAASHIALGQSYAKCFKDLNSSPSVLQERGANSSAVHVDWMIGSDHVDVDGITQDGDRLPLMRKGAWVCMDQS